jgi:carboxypeptidase Taq
MTAYQDLIAFQRETEALDQIAGRLGWDQETMMPRGSADQRGEETAALASVLHARRTDPRLAEWLDRAKAPDAAGQRMLDLIARSYRRNTRVPGKLAAEIARVTSIAMGTWADARARNDVAHFQPTLENVVRLIREKAEALADGGDPYDALLEDYEPDATGDGLAQMFDRMRPRLVALRNEVLGAAYAPAALSRSFAPEDQLKLARAIADAFGFDWARGRMDLSVHPFSSGSGNDVRITTRLSDADPFNCLYSTLHEVGHACYEQGVDQAWLLTPLGCGASTGVHESQSRIYENQLGRSRAFTGWLYARMTQIFGDIGMDCADEFYATVNRVDQGYIRTEADEVHYNLHVMLRFDLERQLIAGTLAVQDLEAAWNARFLKDFGMVVDKPANGVLQDVHWAVGLFGYFPTYSLGNLYAGCLHAALRKAEPDVDESLSTGKAAPATAWLHQNLQRHGALYRPAETVERACGFAPSEGPLLDYLETKFRAIYRL